MEPVSVSQLLAALFEAHGVEFVVHEGWVAPGGRLPAIRATWYPRGKTGRLDVDVLLEDDDRQFQEAFAGVGEGEAGLRDAWENFCRNSFHVLFSALWDQVDEDQVTVETWQVGGQRFEAHLGNVCTRGADGKVAQLPADLFPSIEAQIRALPLDGRIHWFRHFFCAFDNQRTVEALFDNEPWPAGTERFAGLAWQDSEAYYSARNFLVIKPIPA